MIISGIIFYLHSIMLLLYPHQAISRASPIPDLHSIMLLLYLGSPGKFPCKIRIYIPLCFYFITIHSLPEFSFEANLHSIMLLLYLYQYLLQALHKLIYIPLCFYFIGTDILLFNSSNVSTFHYASTLSFLDQMHFLDRFISTFHYASTLSDPILYTIQCMYLHSIMLLLYPEPPVSPVDVGSLSTFHYASTLSQYMRRSHAPPHTKSTFHYASTLSNRTK